MAKSATSEEREALYTVINDKLNALDVGRDVDAYDIADAVLEAEYRKLPF